ncbi:MAG TPA: CCC motif membrane protein [Flavobacterium sp.]|jgi:hypothetical protein
MEKRNLPNATTVLVLGIISIVTCCCYGIGIVFGIVALVLAAKDMKLYLQSPEVYLNYNNLKIGRVLSIIGIILSALTLLAFIYLSATMTEEEQRDFIKNLQMKAEQQQQEQE